MEESLELEGFAARVGDMKIGAELVAGQCDNVNQAK
jgi:hypothetical protein